MPFWEQACLLPAWRFLRVGPGWDKLEQLLESEPHLLVLA